MFIPTPRNIAMHRLGTRRVVTYDDLTRHWLHLRKRGALEPGRLHVQFILSGGLTHPRLWILRGFEEPPSPEHAHDLADAIVHVIGDEPGTSVAMLSTMSDRDLPTAHELAWCQLIHAATTQTPVRVWPLFHANADTLGLVPPDALIA